MNWYLIHTKPRREKQALINLEQQGYECYFPTLVSEKVHQGSLELAEEPLFPRYVFVRIGQGDTTRGWSPIRSTRGVSRLVSFGNEPAKVSDQLVATLRLQESALRAKPRPLFVVGDRVMVKSGAFAGIEAIYQMADGNKRVMVLIELLSKPVYMSLDLKELGKVG